MYLLDTDTLIYLINGNPRVKASVNTHNTASIYFSVISYGELMFGCKKSQRVSANLTKIELLKDYYKVVDVTVPVMECFGGVKAILQRSGITVEPMDLIIGCTALAMNFTLVTNNVRHYQKIPGLKVENWS